MSDHDEGGCQDAASSGGASSGRQGPPTGFPGGAGEQIGAMNAYDIPRYNSEGYVMGRPETANDPTSAGNVQGAPAGMADPAAAGSYGGPAQGQPAPGTMGHGTMNGTPGEAMAGNGSMGQPAYQPPPQGMAYAGMNPAYGPTMAGGSPTGQPGHQVPPQQTAYAGMGMPPGGPAVPPGYQPPPQGMAYAGMNPAYGPTMAPPGYQPPPGMGPMGTAPVYEGAPGYYAPYPGAPQAHAAAEQTAPAFNAEHYGHIADVVKDIANGEQPDVNKIAALYSGFDTQFWKGALIGAVLTVLLTSETVKTAVAGTLGGIFGAFHKSDSPAADAGTKADAT
ncbi:hypothetical protein [uncultured Desulfosarcina sp.]|uniref:hypothetical protein n=1 Tax=uncultured Desulfosarcina sp. TaxID=218289 RepID=UPI0029C7A029|nr:hypothetical protein [uncultured Desulfosarcina sp.]